MRKLILISWLGWSLLAGVSGQTDSRDETQTSGEAASQINTINGQDRPAESTEEPVAKASAATAEDKAAHPPPQPGPDAASVGQAPGPPVSEIIQNAIRRDEELRDLRQEFLYQLKVVTERLDEDNRVIPDQTKTVTAKIKPGKDITYSADFNDDSPDTPKASRSSSKSRLAGVGGGRSLRRSGGGGDPDDSDKNQQVEDAKKVNAMLDMAKIAPRFNYQRLNDETIRGRRCFVIRFSPKKDQPFSTREEKVINKVGGTIWIDQNDFSIIQTKGKLTEEVDVAWFLATMKKLDFSYQTSELGLADIPVPSDFSMNFDLNIMGYRMAQRQRSSMTDYVKADGATPAPPSPSPASSN